MLCTLTHTPQPSGGDSWEITFRGEDHPSVFTRSSTSSLSLCAPRPRGGSTPRAPAPPGSEVSSGGGSEEEGSVGRLWGVMVTTAETEAELNHRRWSRPRLVQAGPGCLIPFTLLSHVLKWSDVKCWFTRTNKTDQDGSENTVLLCWTHNTL